MTGPLVSQSGRDELHTSERRKTVGLDGETEISGSWRGYSSSKLRHEAALSLSPALCKKKRKKGNPGVA